MFGLGLLWGCLGLKVWSKRLWEGLGLDCFGGLEGSGKKGFWDAWGRLFFGGEMPAASALYIRNMDIPNMDIPNMDIPNMYIPNMYIPNMYIPNMDIPNMDSPNPPTPPNPPSWKPQETQGTRGCVLPRTCWGLSCE